MQNAPLSWVIEQGHAPLPPRPPSPSAAFCLSRLWLPACGRLGPCTPAALVASFPPCAFSPRDAFRAVWVDRFMGQCLVWPLEQSTSQLSKHRHRRVGKGWEWGLPNVHKHEDPTRGRVPFISCCNQWKERWNQPSAWVMPKPLPSPRLSFLLFGRGC